eukprot:7820051-Prorocentrum_lima.AAC.1
MDSPWSPHLGLHCSLDLAFEGVQGRHILRPAVLQRGLGPDLPWHEYVNQVEYKEEGFSYPIDQHMTSSCLTTSFGEFSLAAERLLMGRVPSIHKHRLAVRGSPL